MSITRSYNKQTGKYYAYETEYVWDESKQKKVQKRRCIGQFDPDTGEIVPNRKRGRPSKNITRLEIYKMNEGLRDVINRALTMLWVVADSDAPYNETAMYIAESLEYELDKTLQKEGETYN